MQEEIPALGEGQSFAGFARGALSEAEREIFDAAGDAEGLDNEIAVIRVKLLSAMKESDPDLKTLQVLGNLLVRAVSAQYRMSPASRRKLFDGVTDVLQGIGDQILPPDR